MIASERGEVGLPRGIGLLCAERSAIDAVEAAIRLVEANRAGHYVGIGGLLNLFGVDGTGDRELIIRRHNPLEKYRAFRTAVLLTGRWRRRYDPG